MLAQALAATRGAGVFPDLLSYLPSHRLCPSLCGRRDRLQGKPPGTAAGVAKPGVIHRVATGSGGLHPPPHTRSNPSGASANRVPHPGMTSCTPWHRVTTFCKLSQIMPPHRPAPRTGDWESLGPQSRGGERVVGQGATVTLLPIPLPTKTI